MITRQKRGDLDILTIANQAGKAELSLFGAHVLSFKPTHDNRDRLWVSETAKFDRSRPIRGGIPICWPWFGDAPEQFAAKATKLPSHGFIRNQDCNLVLAESLSATQDQVVLRPQHYAYPELGLTLALDIIITVSDTLTVELVTRNTGATEIEFFAALHSYFAVSSIESAVLSGIDVDYLDKTQGMQLMPAVDRYVINGETDRVHLGKCPAIILADDKNKTTIRSSGNDSIVIWNPWIDVASSMADMQDDGYLTMLCVETARTQHGRLAADQAHTLTQIIE